MTVDLYRRPVGMTDPAGQVGRLAGLPRGPAALASIVQGLMIHEHIAPAYGVELTAAQQAEAHVRPVEAILASIAAHDPAPLAAPRPAAGRQVGVCRHFTLLHLAMLRCQGVAARARVGFADYFQKGKFLDHWVTELWDDGRQGWVLADPQLDARQRTLFAIDFDPMDVPRERFLVAGDAWKLCRTGGADPQAFGVLDLFGLWMIAGNIVRDLAALNNREMLPWDCWEPMPRPDAPVDMALFDRLAELSHAPDAHGEELHRVYRDRLAVPPTVLNAVRNRLEPAQ